MGDGSAQEYTEVEEQNRTALLRERLATERAEREEEELETVEDEANASSSGQPQARRLNINPIEIGGGAFIGICLDLFEALGALTAAIPLVGLAIAGASAVIGFIMSIIMGGAVALWLLFKGAVPFSKRDWAIFAALAGTVFGNSLINWLPAWTAFFIWLFFWTYKKKLLPSIIK